MPEISELEARITELEAEVVNRDRVIDNLSGRLLAAARQVEAMRDEWQTLINALRAPGSQNGSYSLAVGRLVQASSVARATLKARGLYKLDEKRAYEELTAALAEVMNEVHSDDPRRGECRGVHPEGNRGV